MGNPEITKSIWRAGNSQPTEPNPLASGPRSMHVTEPMPPLLWATPGKACRGFDVGPAGWDRAGWGSPACGRGLSVPMALGDSPHFQQAPACGEDKTLVLRIAESRCVPQLMNALLHTCVRRHNRTSVQMHACAHAMGVSTGYTGAPGGVHTHSAHTGTWTSPAHV